MKLTFIAEKQPLSSVLDRGALMPAKEGGKYCSSWLGLSLSRGAEVNHFFDAQPPICNPQNGKRECGVT